jgi:hypothetical protein
MTVMVAPFASACRQLAETSQPAVVQETVSPEPAH